jgi:hypothetical protein
MFIARQRLGKQVLAVTNKEATIHALFSSNDENCVSVGFAPILYKEDRRPAEK